MRSTSWLRRGRMAAMLLAAGLGSGCFGLPHYAQPNSTTVDSASLSTRDIIAYRDLSTADFLAPAPPPAVAGHQDRFNAYSCFQLRPLNDAPLKTTQVKLSDGKTGYSVAPIGLRYEAYFDRQCSWWNAKRLSLPQDYVLQHEQIHFLIIELGARRLNRRTAAITAEVTSVAADAETAKAATKDKLSQVMRNAMREVDARHLRFDHDASNGFHPAQQTQWWQRLSLQLQAASAEAATAAVH